MKNLKKLLCLSLVCLLLFSCFGGIVNAKHKHVYEIKNYETESIGKINSNGTQHSKIVKKYKTCRCHQRAPKPYDTKTTYVRHKKAAIKTKKKVKYEVCMCGAYRKKGSTGKWSTTKFK